MKHNKRSYNQGVYIKKLQEYVGLKRYLRIEKLVNLDKERNLRYNYLKLSKGFKRFVGESVMISKLNKRRHTQYKFITKGNIDRLHRFQLRHRARIIHRIMEN